MSEFTGGGFTPIQRGSKLADRIYREQLQKGMLHEHGLRTLYAWGYVQGGGREMLDSHDAPIREYDEARSAFLSHSEALDEVLLAGYQVSPHWIASEARRFARRLAGL